jgi:YjbE family integral membrane protein
MAVAGLPPQNRTKIIFWGVVGATLLRIGFAAVTTQLLQIIGLTLAGGLLLLWVTWRMYRELRLKSHNASSEVEQAAHAAAKTPRQAMIQIIAADVSMSLDNVLAVAGAAREHPMVLVTGLLLSIALMGAAASLIARLLQRWRWIGYAGLAIVLYVALHMIWEGHRDVVADLGGAAAYNAVVPGALEIGP